MSSNGTKSNISKAMYARTEAYRRLVRLHEDEYAQIVGDVRESLGLTRVSGPFRLTEIERLERRLERVKTQLAEARAKELVAG